MFGISLNTLHIFDDLRSITFKVNLLKVRWSGASLNDAQMFIGQITNTRLLTKLHVTAEGQMSRCKISGYEKKKRERIKGCWSLQLSLLSDSSTPPLEGQHHQDDRSHNRDKQFQNTTTTQHLVFKMLRHPLPEERLQATRARDWARATICSCLSSIAESAAKASTISCSTTVTGTLINSLPALGTDSHGLRPRLLTGLADRRLKNLPLYLFFFDNINMAHDFDSLELRNGLDSLTGDFDLLDPLDGLHHSLLPVLVLGLRAGLTLSANDLAGVDNSCEMDSLSPLNTRDNLPHRLHWDRSRDRGRDRSRDRDSLMNHGGNWSSRTSNLLDYNRVRRRGRL